MLPYFCGYINATPYRKRKIVVPACKYLDENDTLFFTSDPSGFFGYRCK